MGVSLAGALDGIGKTTTAPSNSGGSSVGALPGSRKDEVIGGFDANGGRAIDVFVYR